MKVIYILLFFIIGFICAISVLRYDEYQQQEKYRKEFDYFLGRITKGNVNVSKEVRQLNWRMEQDFNFSKRKKLLDELIEKLRKTDFTNVSYSDQHMVIWSIYMAQQEIWNKMLSPYATDYEIWEYKLQGLSWCKSQLDRISALFIPDEEYDAKKLNNHDVYMHLKTCYKKIQGTFELNLKQCVYAAEVDRYSDEFRAWCFKEIEKIIGRPLTDDDIMFKDEVLRRRAKRLIDRIPNAWNESVVSFTNIAYKASAAINRIAGQRNRLKCAEAYSDRIKECLNKLDNSDSKSSLMADSVKLSSEQKESLLKIVVDITGETPKWYQKELDEKLK